VGRLIYAAMCSLDGYTEDESGDFGWAMPDEEVHKFANDLERPLGTYVYGRRMYETMAYWETDDPDWNAVLTDYAEVWRAADKVVYSRTLTEVGTARTRLAGEFDPAELRELKERSGHDIGIGGPTIAAEALRAGLVDEVALLLFPVVVGGGKPALPDGLRAELKLLDDRRFESGVVYLRYAVG
jgi:dihydrofolate reductase